MENVLDNSLFEAFASSSDNVYVYVTDMTTGMTRFSKNAVEFFGLPEEYMANVLAIFQNQVHPDDWDGYLADIMGVLTGKSTHHSYQYRIRNIYGKYTWVECKGSVIEKDGKQIVFAGLMTRLDNQNKYDPVTGLATLYDFYNYDFKNKKGFLLLVGIDKFRKIVSNFGYSFGDKVLVEFSKRIKELCGSEGRVFRMNGDEFLFILENADREAVETLFNNIKSVSEEIEFEDGRKVSFSVTGGAAEFPADGTGRETLLNNAEHSLEYRKSRGRGALAVFSKKIADGHVRVQKLRDELKESINNDFEGFTLFFQPIVNGASNRIIGCEALLRWKGSTVTDSRPDEFIKILEDDGDIIPVGRWVMEQAVKQQSIWNKIYPGIIVSFNVSYQQFADDNFVDNLIETVHRYDVSPECMIVELTESCRVEQADALAECFGRLRKEGFYVALDDFGTAYASLEMLKKLPASIIKIEHSFVRELSEPGHEIDYIIIDSLLALSRKLNCHVIVEGVESGVIADMIRKLDSTFLQGYYYSRPVSRADFEKMLSEDNEKYKDT